MLRLQQNSTKENGGLFQKAAYGNLNNRLLVAKWINKSLLLASDFVDKTDEPFYRLMSKPQINALEELFYAIGDYYDGKVPAHVPAILKTLAQDATVTVENIAKTIRMNCVDELYLLWFLREQHTKSPRNGKMFLMYTAHLTTVEIPRVYSIISYLNDVETLEGPDEKVPTEIFFYQRVMITKTVRQNSFCHQKKINLCQRITNIRLK